MDKRVDQFHASSTSLSRERRATRMAVQRRLFAVCRGKLDSNCQFEFIYPRLCSQSFLRFSKPIFLLRERKEFLILSPISFDPIIARLFPNRVSSLNNSSSSPIVKLECNSAVNQN